MGRKRRGSVDKVYSTGKIEKVVDEVVPYKILSQSVGVIKKRRAARAVQTISSLVEPTKQLIDKMKER
jgi:hypothetical protein